MSRWLGVDHGTKRIGIAAGSTADGVATPLGICPAEPLEDAIRHVVELAARYGATGVVVGWPLNMDDTEGPQGRLARQMAAELAAGSDLDVRMWDERLSSFQADQALAGHYTRKKKKARQDAVAAAAILQDFLSSGGPEGAPRPDELNK